MFHGSKKCNENILAVTENFENAVSTKVVTNTDQNKGKAKVRIKDEINKDEVNDKFKSDTPARNYNTIKTDNCIQENNIIIIDNYDYSTIGVEEVDCSFLFFNYRNLFNLSRLNLISFNRGRNNLEVKDMEEMTIDDLITADKREDHVASGNNKNKTYAQHYKYFTSNNKNTNSDGNDIDLNKNNNKSNKERRCRYCIIS